MKVIYKKTIFDKINDEIVKAEKEGKKIEKIVLNLDEWKEFCNSPSFKDSIGNKYTPISFKGIYIEPERCDYNLGLKISYPYF